MIYTVLVSNGGTKKVLRCTANEKEANYIYGEACKHVLDVEGDYYHERVYFLRDGEPFKEYSGYYDMEFTAATHLNVSSQRERAIEVLKREFAKLDNTPHEFDNTFGCGNCGDTGTHYGLLHRISEAFGITDKELERG